jgi:hypothetical protein
VRSGSEQKTFSFSFLLILDEGGLREGRVKSAYSSLAATAATQFHPSIHPSILAV